MNKGFSFIEVLVAAIIFTLSIAGIFAAIGSFTKPPVVQSSENVTAALYGQKILDALRSEVSTAQWGNNQGLLSTSSAHSLDPDPAFPGYSATYSVQEENGVRKVTLNITSP